MARQPRLSLTGQLHHALLRGHGQQPVFVDAQDRALFLDLLAQHAPTLKVELHAWALMPDHIHLLLSPTQDGALSALVQAVGRVYVQAFNRRHGHRGTLWEGRYRSTVLEPDPWLLRAMVWMDSHPLRSGCTDQHGAHPWTSAAHYLGLQVERAITVPPQFWALGNTPFAREAAYRTLLEQGSNAATCRALAQAALKGWALGSADFVAALQAQSSRRLEKAQPGRPPRRGTVVAEE